MQTTTRKPTDATPTVPPTIESPQAKLVYVYLAAEREATVDELADALELRKLGLFSVLATLEARGHVERDGPEAVTFAR
jgi:predicted ArsR family transcriptional regulator